ncbi:DUF5107 domain-containing protein [Microbacterium nymphoidis]|uniref:DUF5107 domain-containing protein n=1 Tax=Microbacterium nymphoidis TaxID=2898586 RepID=UPI001E31657F|nr:DUF5107 domain-containing protein [Microbacterium nymphoidis]MCD2497628.1 DUF5107 domain-containing protein [Microbacterium nymphoidis]
MAPASLRVHTLSLPSATLGDPVNLVPVRRTQDLHAIEGGEQIDDELRAGLGYGHVRNVAPYLPQQDYDRTLTDRDHRVIVLENDHLRAEVLPDLGGRLRRLYDKDAQRELLHVNAVFQPGNLALRNAWFSGGVEWNIGTIGHTPLTASTLHAVEVERPDGAAAVRLYEYERLRGVVYSVEFVLGAHARELLVRNTITDVRESSEPVPMYWWSNIAVDQTAGTRVIAPAHGAWKFAYRENVHLIPVGDDAPRPDITRPALAPQAADYFFDLDEKVHPWIAAVEPDGRGLLQVSDAPLRGRKLFVWGESDGGRRWQSWLSHGTGSYLEIQAGLARTQLEHVPMPAGATWSWTEAYGLLEVDGAVALGDSWDAAIDEVASSPAAERLRAAIEAESIRSTAQDRVGDALSVGSGWGALEQRRRIHTRTGPFDDSQTPFRPNHLGAEQEGWLQLLRGGPFPEGLPLGYQRDDAWVPFLEKEATPDASFALGVIHAAQGRLEEAGEAFSAAARQQDTWYVQRALAELAEERGELTAAREHALRAQELAAPVWAVVDLGELLLRLGAPADALRAATTAEEERPGGRARMLRAQALVALERYAEARDLLTEGIDVADLAEGDDALTALWRTAAIGIQRAADPSASSETLAERAAIADPLPARYDFRMSVDA